MFLRFNRKSVINELKEQDDRNLILKYLETHNSEPIAILFQRYTHLVYGVCLNYLSDPDDAKDAVMEIFEGLMDSLLKHEVVNFKSWLHSVTRNHCLMVLRKNKTVAMDRDKISRAIDENIMETGEDLHQEDVLERYKTEDLGHILETLKEPQRRCIELVYLEDKSYQEVSKITGYSLNEVKSHVQNGKRNLKIRLEAQK